MNVNDMYSFQGAVAPSQASNLCNCMGPQRGEPVCPCQMRGVVIENGRYMRHQDLGPAPVETPPLWMRPDGRPA